jgi:hypothetical protein
MLGGRLIESKFGLILNFTKDLNKFLQSASNIVCVRKFLKLPRYLLCRLKCQRRVLPHLLVICIAIAVCSNNKVDIMA